MEETIRAALIKHKPEKVCVFLGEELHRTIAVPKRKQRWAAVLDVLEPMEWTTIELRTAKDEILSVLVAEREAVGGSAAETTDRDERLLKLLIAAQREALTYREREASAALNACVTVMRQMTDAVAALSNMHELQLNSLRRAASELPEGKDGQLASAKLLEMVAPQLLAKLLGTDAPKVVQAPPASAKPAAPPAPKPPNGA